MSNFIPIGIIPTKASGEIWGDDEYFACKDLHSTALSTFADHPDKVRLKQEAKYEYIIGHAFEDMVKDKATGSNDFEGKYFLSDLDYASKTESTSKVGAKAIKNIPELLENNEDLSQYYILKADGTRNKTYSKLHAALDECIENDDMKPICRSDYDNLEIMLDNFFKMEVDINGKYYKISKLLTNAKYQVPVIWESENGVKKCALIDVLVFLEIKEYDRVYNTVVAFDIKTSANESTLDKMVKNKYWIQAFHYLEGLQSIPEFNNVYPNMIFIIAMKSAPFYSMPLSIDPESNYKCIEKYSDLCLAFKDWDDKGRPKIGTKKHKYMRVYPDNFGQFTIPDQDRSCMDMIDDIPNNIKESEYKLVEG